MSAASLSAPPSRNSSSSTSWYSWTSQSSAGKDEPVLRVGVIGGGIAGLTLAQLLRDTPNVEVTVYEKSVESVDRLCGYRIMLSYFVLQNLQAILRPDVWSKVSASVGVQPTGGQELRLMKRCVPPFGNLLSWTSTNDHAATEQKCSPTTPTK